VLLAALPPDVLRHRLLDWQATRLTPHTIVEKKVLLEELHRVAERGWAQNLEEGAHGAASVAAPVRDEDGLVIAAVSVVGPISRARQALPRHRNAVIDAARLISTRIGHRLIGGV
jgi:DNA-binding IclR family transcriptional regulator